MSPGRTGSGGPHPTCAANSSPRGRAAVSGSVSRPALLALSVLQSCSHPQHPALILTREGGTSRAGCGTQHPRGDRGRERCARAPCGVASGAGQQPDSIPATRFRLQGHRTCAGSGTEFSAQSRTFTINSDFGILLGAGSRLAAVQRRLEAGLGPPAQAGTAAPAGPSDPATGPAPPIKKSSSKRAAAHFTWMLTGPKPLPSPCSHRIPASPRKSAPLPRRCSNPTPACVPARPLAPSPCNCRPWPPKPRTMPSRPCARNSTAPRPSPPVLRPGDRTLPDSTSVAIAWPTSMT